jgi:N6-adenosine-specific RNA methylase IME4
VRGEPVLTLTNQSTLLLAPKGEHSAKPDAFYALVESLCPAPRYLELFARKARPSWDVWGDEVPPGDYDAADDFARSIDACYEAVRERVKNGGPGWPPQGAP